MSFLPSIVPHNSYRCLQNSYHAGCGEEREIDLQSGRVNLNVDSAPHVPENRDFFSTGFPYRNLYTESYHRFPNIFADSHTDVALPRQSALIPAPRTRENGFVRFSLVPTFYGEMLGGARAHPARKRTLVTATRGRIYCGDRARVRTFFRPGRATEPGPAAKRALGTCDVNTTYCNGDELATSKTGRTNTRPDGDTHERTLCMYMQYVLCELHKHTES